MPDSSEELAQEMGVPLHIAQPALVTYRSVGIGVFGAVMRFAGMPLEKMALYMNSSQVSGKGQLGQAIKLTFQYGALAPYRVVGPASMTAWFLQYSVMGVAFQFFDQGLSQLLNVQPVVYGRELMEEPTKEDVDWDYQLRAASARLLSPMMAASLESAVSNRAEVQRFYGLDKFQALSKHMTPAQRLVGPAYGANAMRNVIMCQTSFLLTPMTYREFFPQEQKSKTTLFWYGLSVNIFVGNVVAITQQALWGRSLDYLEQNGRISYRSVIQNGLEKEGKAAFFTGPKWFSRVLMNAPAQGTLPWFYNEVLPLGEEFVLGLTKSLDFSETPTFAIDDVPSNIEPVPTKVHHTVSLKRRRSNLGSLPTAHPEFQPHRRHPTEMAANSPR